jgi:hypothetical protein
MKTNDLKKGARVRLASGWYATLMDNRKGNTRDAKVEGHLTEIGSVYSHDIIYLVDEKGTHIIEHTPAQLKLKKMVQSFGM